MPWLETDVEHERLKFVALLEEHGRSMSELCRAFGVSRTTGYKWLARYREGGPASLVDQARNPHHRPNETPREVQRLILREKKRHPTWGAKKLISFLEKAHPEIGLPHRSTVDALLKRHGLVRARGSRRRATPSRETTITASTPNDEWAVDFKGWFRLGNGERCEPLTITDSYSRFCLDCRIVSNTSFDACRGAFERVFREHGLPRAIRSDNGAPFASTGISGLSRFSVWLLHLGVMPVRIEPGKPQQNGRHERFHQTLKDEACEPPSKTRRAQQRRFNAFRQDYNEVRPHEALEQRPPAEVHEASPRAMPMTIEPFEYPDCDRVYTVQGGGAFRWVGTDGGYIGRALSGERLGFRQIGERIWEVYVGPLLLGHFDEPTRSIIPLPRR